MREEVGEIMQALIMTGMEDHTEDSGLHPMGYWKELRMLSRCESSGGLLPFRA